MPIPTRRLIPRTGRGRDCVPPTVDRMAVVSARGLVRTFGTGRAARRVLDGCDLDVARGEIVAVLGRSGSGKSTLLHVLGGLDRPEAGTVEVAGEPVTGAGERRLSELRRRHIGFVFQFFHLLPELTGEGNVLLAGPRARRAPGRGRARAGADRAARASSRSPAACRISSRAASSSASRSPARSSTTRRSCSRTSRRATSTSRPAPACSRLLRELADEGRGVVVVTHEAAAAAGRRPRPAAAGRPPGARVTARARGLLAALGVFAARARGRHRRHGRVRAGHRLRAGGGAGGPAARDRARRPPGPRARRRPRARAAEPRRAVLPALVPQRVHRRPRPSERQGDHRPRPRRPARLRRRRGARRARAGRGRRRARPRARVGARAR